MRLVSIAAMAAALIATPAFAQNGWTGFHVGVGVGGSHAENDLSAYASVDGVAEADFIDSDYLYSQDWFAGTAEAAANAGKSKFLGTVEAGYDYQVGTNYVVGVFGNYDFGSNKASHLYGTGGWAAGTDYGDYLNGDGNIDHSEAYDTSLYDAGMADIAATAQLKDSWAVGARAGYLASSSTLLYVAGGYTQAKIRLTGTGTLYPSDLDYVGLAGADVTSATISGDKWKGGYFIGGGVETLLGNNVSAKVEYRYADYGDYSISGGDTFSITASPYPVEGSVSGGVSAHNITNQSVRLVLSYRFQ